MAELNTAGALAKSVQPSRYTDEDSFGSIVEVHGPVVRIACKKLLSIDRPSRFQFPPFLNLNPEGFLEQILDHYLYGAMYQVFYESFMAENRQRFRHRENALKRLEKESITLTSKMNSLRQEEITEEIEVIMLSVETLSSIPSKR